MNKYIILILVIFALFYLYMMLGTGISKPCNKNKKSYDNIIQYPYIDETIIYDKNKSLSNYEYEQMQYDILRRQLR